MDCVRGWIGNWGVIWDWDGHTGLLGDYHTSDCEGWTLLLIDCNRWEPSGNRLTISSNISLSGPAIILWQCTFEILIFNILRFFLQIFRILLNQDPALLLQLKVSLYRHSSLYFCDETVISSILSIDYIYIYFPVLQWKTTFHQFKGEQERKTGMCERTERCIYPMNKSKLRQPFSQRSDIVVWIWSNVIRFPGFSEGCLWPG